MDPLTAAGVGSRSETPFTTFFSPRTLFPLVGKIFILIGAMFGGTAIWYHFSKKAPINPWLLDLSAIALSILGIRCQRRNDPPPLTPEQLFRQKEDRTLSSQEVGQELAQVAAWAKGQFDAEPDSILFAVACQKEHSSSAAVVPTDSFAIRSFLDEDDEALGDPDDATRSRSKIEDYLNTGIFNETSDNKPIAKRDTAVCHTTGIHPTKKESWLCTEFEFGSVYAIISAENIAIVEKIRDNFCDALTMALKDYPKDKTGVFNAITDAFVSIDLFLQEQEISGDATMTMAMILGNQLWVATLGLGRALVNTLPPLSDPTNLYLDRFQNEVISNGGVIQFTKIPRQTTLELSQAYGKKGEKHQQYVAFLEKKRSADPLLLLTADRGLHARSLGYRPVKRTSARPQITCTPIENVQGYLVLIPPGSREISQRQLIQYVNKNSHAGTLALAKGLTRLTVQSGTPYNMTTIVVKLT